MDLKLIKNILNLISDSDVNEVSEAESEQVLANEAFKNKFQMPLAFLPQFKICKLLRSLRRHSDDHCHRCLKNHYHVNNHTERDTPPVEPLETSKDSGTTGRIY